MMDWNDFVKAASVANPYAPRPPSAAQRRLRRLKWVVAGAFAVAGVLGVACLSPDSRAVPVGLARGERFADGMPRHYWLASARADYKNPWAFKALADIGRGDVEAVQTLADALPADPDADNSGRTETRAALRALEKLGPDAKAALPKICVALTNKDAAIRHAAASAVASIGTDDALDHLRSRLTDADPKVRAGAAEAIGVLAPHSDPAVAALTAALEDQDDMVRYRAAEALGDIGPSAASAVPGLMQLKGGGLGGSPQRAAIVAFGKIGPAAKAAVPELVKELGDVLEGEEAGRSLAAIGPDAAPALVETVCAQDTDETARKNAVAALRRIGGPATAALVARLHDLNPFVRAAAAKGLELLDDGAETAVPDLLHALHDDAAGVRAEAALALGFFSRRADASAPALAAALADPDPAVGAKAAEALGYLGPRAKAAVPELTRLARDRGAAPNMRYHAAQALVKIGDGFDAAVPVLTDALGEADRRVGAEAAESLGLIGPAAAPAVPALLVHTWDYNLNDYNKAKAAVGEIGLQAALPYLIRSVKETKGRAFQPAVEMLGEYGPAAKDAVPALRAAMADDNHACRVLAAQALGRVEPGSPEALAALKELSKDENVNVRELATKALEATGAP